MSEHALDESSESDETGYPYVEIVDGLVASTLRAQRAIVVHLLSGRPLPQVDHREINRHFSWLSFLNKEGTNRHLVDAPEGMAPLATKSLRYRSSVPEELSAAFATCHAVASKADTNGEKALPPSFEPFVQRHRTRISSLIVDSFLDVMEESRLSLSPDQPWLLRSPLSIVYDFLTDPASSGTRAYALVACRNYLFRAFELAPDLDGLDADRTFSVRQIEKSLSHIWTYFRERYLSRGNDPLPPGSRGRIDGLIKHHLSMRRLLNLRFRTADLCLEYLRQGELVPRVSTVRLNGDEDQRSTYKFEFARAERMESLPDSGEIVNELWGLPIPLRGADIVFKGGLKFAGKQGLVMAVHGGPGAGKTSFALSLAAHVAPLGIPTWFLTAEEMQSDLLNRVNGLIPDEVSRLSFFPREMRDYIFFRKFEVRANGGIQTLDEIEEGLAALTDSLGHQDQGSAPAEFRIRRPCNAIVVLDGLHDLFATGSGEKALGRLYEFIGLLRRLRALVILTTGAAWEGEPTLDYLVDVAVRLSLEATGDYGKKPDRRFILTKARHQLCANGTHGFHIGGLRGVRLSPQINYQLEKLAYWRPRLPNREHRKPGLSRARVVKSMGDLAQILRSGRGGVPDQEIQYRDSVNSVRVQEGSHVFINGQGSGGKAALAMKLAISPTLEGEDVVSTPAQQRVLVVSFLYPADYYQRLTVTLQASQRVEYRAEGIRGTRLPRVRVIHLYPGYLRPHDLFNRIESELDAAELDGDGYNCVVIDGIHNVFLQFPEIEDYRLFWPQMYSALRSRRVTTISTHTTLALPYETGQSTTIRVDDNRSEPLRHALIQKTDFQFEVDPWRTSPFTSDFETLSEDFSAVADLFVVKTVSAIGERVPRGHVLWSRESLELYDLPKEYFAAQGSAG
jgi:hypothetical protein